MPTKNPYRDSPLGGGAVFKEGYQKRHPPPIPSRTAFMHVCLLFAWACRYLFPNLTFLPFPQHTFSFCRSWASSFSTSFRFNSSREAIPFPAVSITVGGEERRMRVARAGHCLDLITSKNAFCKFTFCDYSIWKNRHILQTIFVHDEKNLLLDPIL